MVRRVMQVLGVVLVGWGGLAGGGEASVLGLPAQVSAELRPTERLPGGRYAAERAWEAEGERFGHRVGKAVPDADASGGTTWQALASPGDGLGAAAGEPEAGGAAGYLVYGPYDECAPGAFVAFFRLKLLDNDAYGEVASLDACVGHGETVLAERRVGVADLSPQRYVMVPLAFRYAGGLLECRVNGSAAASLALDRVELYRVTEADEAAFEGRVAQPEPSGQPSDLVADLSPRPFPELFPRSASPAPELLVADLRPLPVDWRLCLLSLQGLVNRSVPRLYCLSQETDQEWLDWLVKRGWVKQVTVAPRADELVARFADVVRGAIIPDPALPASVNVATMLAGCRGALVASPRIVRRLKLPVLENLQGRWATSVEAYRWAFDTLWPELDHRVSACLWPDNLGLRDYLVQHRVPIFWLPGRIDGARPCSRPAEEVRVVEELLAKLPPNTPVLGYPYAGKDVGMGEGPGVTLLAEFGKFLVGSVDCTNLSVHSGVRQERFQRQAPAVPELRRDRVHVAIVISDGDNLPVLTVYNFPQLWKDPLRGQLPLGWSISPATALLLPDVADYYSSTATAQDCLLVAVSGVGYTYPDSYGRRFRQADRGPLFDGFLDLTRAGMAVLDLHQAWIMNATRPEVIRCYAERIPELTALFPDYGRRVTTYDEAVYSTANRTAVFHAANGWIEAAPRGQQIANVASQIRSLAPPERPAFLHLFVWNWGFDLGMLRDVMQELGPEYVAVRPDHLGALYRQFLTEEGLSVRFPRQVAAIERLSLRLAGQVQNPTAGDLLVHATVESGLAKSQLEWGEHALAPDATAGLQLTGVPTGSEIVLGFAAGALAKRHAIACLTVPQAEVVGLLPTNLTLRFARLLEAEDLSHRSGQIAVDATASGGTAWSALPGRDEPGHILFGPYVATPAGTYLALFRLRRGGEAKDPGRLLTLDTALASPFTVTAARDLAATEFPTEDYRWVPLRFTHPGGPLETRAWWSGTAPVYIDRIAVWETGAGPRATVEPSAALIGWRYIATSTLRQDPFQEWHPRA